MRTIQIILIAIMVIFTFTGLLAIYWDKILPSQTEKFKSINVIRKVIENTYITLLNLIIKLGIPIAIILWVLLFIKALTTQS